MYKKYSSFLILVSLFFLGIHGGEVLAQQVCSVGAVNNSPGEVNGGQAMRLILIGQGNCTGWSGNVIVRCALGGSFNFTGSAQTFTSGQTQLEWNWNTPSTNPCGGGNMRESFTIRGAIGTTARTNSFFVNYNVAQLRYACNATGGCVASTSGQFTNPSCNNACSSGGGIGNISSRSSYNLEVPNPIELETLTELLTVVINWIFTISIPIVVAVIIWSGIKFITARGDMTKIGEAKKMLWWAIIGLVIILIGGGFITLINSILALG